MYGGVRVVLRANLGRARVRIQIDVGYGDIVCPSPEVVAYPTLLDHPEPRIAAYHPATVVAEKLEALVALGIANSRMKDFFDLLWMAEHLEFEGDNLIVAVRATFKRRRTLIPEERPVALSSEFAADTSKQIQWKAFVRKSYLMEPVRGLQGVVEGLHHFLGPLLEDAVAGQSPGHWRPGGPWQREERG